MKCPYCNEVLPFILCPGCKEEVPEKSRYCLACGNPIVVEVDETDSSERKLCTDGNCVGTINEKGVCNICGKPHRGEPV